jgi:predicted secreted hydrolase
LELVGADLVAAQEYFVNVARLAIALLVLLASACGRPVAPLPDVPAAAPTPAPPVTFPRDAGPHDALTEWWYYTGHLQSTTDGHQYGFEFTIFQARRQAVPTGYLAHFAISDIDGGQFSHQSRVAQGEPATAFPLDVSGWTLASANGTDVLDGRMDPGPGADPAFGLHLEVTDDKPPALHHGGYIDYGAAGGSYYYSRTRLHASGTVQRADGTLDAVTGMAWMDHQWGNFVVSAAGGWDWYSLQLDDRTELMLYVLRAPDGQTTSAYGTHVLADGSVVDIPAGSVESEALGTWTSPHTSGVYPSGWRLTLDDGSHLELRPQLVDQELYFPALAGTGFNLTAYWEGAVSVTGDKTGEGYVELTGYAGR